MDRKGKAMTKILALKLEDKILMCKVCIVLCNIPYPLMDTSAPACNSKFRNVCAIKKVDGVSNCWTVCLITICSTIISTDIIVSRLCIFASIGACWNSEGWIRM
jgi:hypothetical protein